MQEVLKKYNYNCGNTVVDITIYKDLSFALHCKTLLDECTTSGKVHPDVLDPSWKFVDGNEIGRIKTESGGSYVAVTNGSNLTGVRRRGGDVEDSKWVGVFIVVTALFCTFVFSKAN